jgi:DNA segregation ATPase FtsK/SpoIIIE-like protein
MTAPAPTPDEMTQAMFPPPVHQLDPVFEYGEKSPTLAPVRVGVYVKADGTLDELLLPMPGDGGRHWLIGGSSGAGKTVQLLVLVNEVAPRPHLALVLQDPKRNEFSLALPRATTVAKRPGSAVQFLDRVMWAMESRFDHMDRAGLQQLEPSAEWPYLLAVFDEFAALGRNASSKEVKARHDRVEEIAQMGRSAGIGLVICTQRPSADAVPMSVRDQMRIRVAFGCESWQQSNMILGDSTGFRADSIPESKPGRAFVKVDRSVTEFRSYFTTGKQTAAICERHASLRVQLDGWPHVIDPTAKEA